MTRRFLPLLPALALGLLLPVSGHAQDKPKPPKPPKPVKIEIEVVPGALRFATTRFDVNAGNEVELTLKNTCIMPHNLVLGKPGKADEITIQAMSLGNAGFGKSFIPDSPAVITATKIINPGVSEELKFKAPTEPGEYPYLCTFPGHGTVMRGIMHVKATGEKLEKPVKEKFETFKLVDALKESGATSKPMGSRTLPYIMRSFVPNPGLDDAVLSHHDRGLPARPYNPNTGQDTDGKDIAAISGLPTGIAVNFGPDFSYVWDSTECRLMYAWTGGFLNMTAYWGVGTGGGRRANDYVPRLEGTLVYKAAGPLPLRLGEGRPKFRGYKMSGGSPEFIYEIGGVTVHEHIVPTDPGTFMIHYRIAKPPETVKVTFDPSVRPQISCDGGSWKENTLEIPADHGDHFMLTVRYQPGQEFKPEDPAKANKANTNQEP